MRNRYWVGREQFETIADAKHYLLTHQELFADHNGGTQKQVTIRRGFDTYGVYILFGGKLIEVDKGNWRKHGNSAYTWS